MEAFDTENGRNFRVMVPMQIVGWGYDGERPGDLNVNLACRNGIANKDGMVVEIGTEPRILRMGQLLGIDHANHANIRITGPEVNTTAEVANLMTIVNPSLGTYMQDGLSAESVGDMKNSFVTMSPTDIMGADTQLPKPWYVGVQIQNGTFASTNHPHIMLRGLHQMWRACNYLYGFGNIGYNPESSTEPVYSASVAECIAGPKIAGEFRSGFNAPPMISFDNQQQFSGFFGQPDPGHYWAAMLVEPMTDPARFANYMSALNMGLSLAEVTSTSVAKTELWHETYRRLKPIEERLAAETDSIDQLEATKSAAFDIMHAWTSMAGVVLPNSSQLVDCVGDSIYDTRTEYGPQERLMELYESGNRRRPSTAVVSNARLMVGISDDNPLNRLLQGDTSGVIGAIMQNDSVLGRSPGDTDTIDVDYLQRTEQRLLALDSLGIRDRNFKNRAGAGISVSLGRISVFTNDHSGYANLGKPNDPTPADKILDNLVGKKNRR